MGRVGIWRERGIPDPVRRSYPDLQKDVQGHRLAQNGHFTPGASPRLTEVVVADGVSEQQLLQLGSDGRECSDCIHRTRLWSRVR